MATTTKRSPVAAVMNLPNQLTVARLILSVALFALMAYEFYLSGLVVFLLAVSTDWLDGYFARKWGQVTTLGRILDPFVDKVIICGTFILLVGVSDVSGLKQWLRPWMAVVIVGRELLVTALRGFIEQQGIDFSAKLQGKLKMVLQCVAAAVCLFYLSRAVSAAPPAAWLGWAVVVTVWLAVVVTITSGLEYVIRTVILLRRT